jgi:hypothetical protein
MDCVIHALIRELLQTNAVRRCSKLGLEGPKIDLLLLLLQTFLVARLEAMHTL